MCVINALCSPYIIGVMNQSGGSTTDLQLHHNFRWVLCANHMEPVQGFLLRYLRRRLLDAEVHGDVALTHMDDIVHWLPQVWQLINRLLETHGGSDVTVGQLLWHCLNLLFRYFHSIRHNKHGMAQMTLDCSSLTVNKVLLLCCCP